jgi:hypothetical protein
MFSSHSSLLIFRNGNSLGVFSRHTRSGSVMLITTTTVSHTRSESIMVMPPMRTALFQDSAKVATRHTHC